MLRWVGVGILGKGLIAPSTKLGHRRRGHRLRLVAIAAGTKAGDESLKSRKIVESFVGLIGGTVGLFLSYIIPLNFLAYLKCENVPSWL